jgi:K+/H+ antiporter YhaU regulatory subunit KhtT
MTEVKGTELPGVEVRYEFVTEEGKRVGVVSHRSGRGEIYLAHRDDPDRFERVLRLSEKDARTLAEVLGASRVAEELAELHQKIKRRPPEFGTKIPVLGSGNRRVGRREAGSASALSSSGGGVSCRPPT